MIIGAKTNSDAGTSEGQARVFRYTSGAWLQLGADIDGTTDNEFFGGSVAISNDGATVIAGAIGKSNTSQGRARVYRYINGAWVQLGNDIEGLIQSEYLGWDVDISADGKTVVVGVPQRAVSTTHTGVARVFTYQNGAWVQVGPEIQGEAPLDLAGHGVAMNSSGETVVVGAIWNDDAGHAVGHASIWQRDSGQWIQLGSDIDGEAPDDYLGESVAIIADGPTVALGADTNDSAGVGAGHVRVFKYLNEIWTQMGPSLYGQSTLERFGASVDLSSDGRTLAVGGLDHVNRGLVRVFRR